MSKIKAKSIDRNRFEKKYPLIRVPKKLSFLADGEVEIELLSVSFNNESEKDVNFESQQIDQNYRVLLSARDTTDSDSAQVTLSVDDDNSNLAKVRILASAPFTGIVDVIVMRVS